MKKKMDSDKKRIMIWGIITAIVLISAIAGSILFKKGYGHVGSVKIKLDPIVDAYNTLDAVIRDGTTKAKCKGDKIVVNYKLKELQKTTKDSYEITFKTFENIDYIEITYPDAKSKVGNFIAENMMDAIYKVNGGKELVTDKYRITSFGSTTLKDGLVYTKKQEIITVQLNIKIDLMKSIEDRVETIQDSDYIKPEELSEIFTSLQNNRTFKLVKNKTTLYVEEENIYYGVYFKFEDQEIMEKSAASVVSVLRPDVYQKVIDENGKFLLNGAPVQFNMTANVSFTKPGIFEDNSNIYQLIIYKDR